MSNNVNYCLIIVVLLTTLNFSTFVWQNPDLLSFLGWKGSTFFDQKRLKLLFIKAWRFNQQALSSDIKNQ